MTNDTHAGTEIKNNIVFPHHFEICATMRHEIPNRAQGGHA